MKTDKDQEQLLCDVLAEDELRKATLLRGLAEMGRVRRQRRFFRAAAVVCLPLIGLMAIVGSRIFLDPKSSVQAPPRMARVEENVPGTSIRLLNDEQLLELFRGRPVALVGPAGHQRLFLFDEGLN